MWPYNGGGTKTKLYICDAERMVKVDPFRVTIAGKKTYGCINMGDFLNALREKLKPNPTVIENYCRMFVPQAEPVRGGPDEQIKAAVLYRDIQASPWVVIMEEAWLLVHGLLNVYSTAGLLPEKWLGCVQINQQTTSDSVDTSTNVAKNVFTLGLNIQQIRTSFPNVHCSAGILDE